MCPSRTILLALLSGLLSSPVAAQTENVAAGTPRYWENLTRDALADPSTPRFSSEFQRARWVMGVVERELLRQGIRPNTSVAGRAISGVTTGDLTTGTCGHIAILMRAAFKGAGFASHQVFTVIGQAEGVGAYNPLWVNTNHAAVGLVLGGQLVMFDPWEHANATGGWSGMQASRWNGMGFPKWAVAIDDYEKFVWESAEGLSNWTGKSPYSVQEEILARSRVLAAAAWPVRAATPVPAPAGPAPAGGHWKRVSGPTFVKEWNQQPIAGYFQDFQASGVAGAIRMKYHCGDSQHPLEDRSKNYAALTWTTSEDLEYLVPGRKLVLEGRLTHDHDGSASAAAAAHTPEGVHVAYLAREVFATKASTPLRGEMVIPDGGPQRSGLKLEFYCSNSGGVGRVRYFYEWSPGAAR